MVSRPRQRGFSLLEAIVALTILAAVGMALFAAMHQSVQMVARAERSRVADSALRNAMAWVETINPAEKPRGEERLGDVTMRWDAQPVEPPRDAMTGYLQAGLYQVGLYDLRVQLFLDGQPLTETHVRRVGYKQVREPAAL